MANNNDWQDDAKTKCEPKGTATASGTHGLIETVDSGEAQAAADETEQNSSAGS